MPRYYRTNAIYEQLSNAQHNFLWASGNAWILVYGNKIHVEPKFIAFVYGYSWVHDQPLIDAVADISSQSQIPVLFIKFDDEAVSVETVDIFDAKSNSFNTISLNELKEVFHSFGLNVTDGECDKYLNKAKSSAYHEWQRDSLGNQIVVSDLDLIRIDPQTKHVTEICELKRSYYPLSQWQPYRDDYINFDLIYNMMKSTAIQFKIIYNQRISNPWQDIHDPVKVYSYATNNIVELHAQCSFINFVNNTC